MPKIKFIYFSVLVIDSPPGVFATRQSLDDVSQSTQRLIYIVCLGESSSGCSGVLNSLASSEVDQINLAHNIAMGNLILSIVE